jgi:hypothetical protein
MTPEGTMEKGELLAVLKAAGNSKPSKAAIRIDELMPSSSESDQIED